MGLQFRVTTNKRGADSDAENAVKALQAWIDRGAPGGTFRVAVKDPTAVLGLFHDEEPEEPPEEPPRVHVGE